MKVPFAGSVPQHYYEMVLGEASKLLPASASHLVSLKIRPISQWPITSDSEFHNAYVYPIEYKDIYGWLGSSTLTESATGSVSRGKATRYETAEGDSLLFVEHETGPKIVAGLVLASASVGLIKEIVSLVKEIVKAINDRSNEKKTGATGGRYYEAAAISIEERTDSYTRIVTIVPLPMENDTPSTEEIISLLQGIGKIR